MGTIWFNINVGWYPWVNMVQYQCWVVSMGDIWFNINVGWYPCVLYGSTSMLGGIPRYYIVQYQCTEVPLGV